MKTDASKGGQCIYCRQSIVAPLLRKFSSNGALSFHWTCPKCKRHAPFGGPLNIPVEEVRKFLTDDLIEQLPTTVAGMFTRCARCGSRETEEHHWAPKHLFTDADLWPKDYLCTQCHGLWHSKVTPGIS